MYLKKGYPSIFPDLKFRKNFYRRSLVGIGWIERMEKTLHNLISER
jgi:hypothetical protein